MSEKGIVADMRRENGQMDAIFRYPANSVGGVLSFGDGDNAPVIRVGRLAVRLPIFLHAAH